MDQEIIRFDHIRSESYRDLLKLGADPSFSKDTIGDLTRPQRDSEEAILEFWKKFGGSTGHMTGTVKMGRSADPDATGDSSFRIRNVRGIASGRYECGTNFDEQSHASHGLSCGGDMCRCSH